MSANNIKVTPAEGVAGFQLHEAAIREWIASETQRTVRALQKDAMQGDIKVGNTLPLGVLVPAAITYIASMGAKDIVVDEHVLEFGFSPEVFKQIVHPRTMSKLKKINAKFEENENSPGLQAVLDENFFNMFIR